MALTEAQITEELTAIRTAILALTEQSTSMYSHQGRQVVMESARGKLEVLYAREKELLAELARVQAAVDGRSGIRIRYGVPIR